MTGQITRLGKNTLIYGVGGLLNRFIGFFLLPLFTAYLTPTDYGISSMLNMVSYVVGSVFSLGLNAAIGPWYFENNSIERKETVIWTVLFMLGLSAALVVAVGLLLGRPLSSLALFTPQYASLVSLSLCSTALNLLNMPFVLRLQFEERAPLFVTLTVVSTLINIGVSVLFVVALRRGVQGLVRANLIGAAINVGLYAVAIIPRLKFRLDLRMGIELLRFSLPLIPVFVFQFVLLQGNKYLLQLFRSLPEVGVYTIGFNFGMVMNLFVSAFQTAWFPYFMSFLDRREEARVIFGKVFTYYILGFGTLSLVFYLVARPITLLMTQPAFHEAYRVVGLSASAQFLLGTYYILLAGMYLAKEMHYQTLIQLVACLLGGTLNITLIRTNGMSGAGVGLACGILIVPVLTYGWNLHRGYLDVRYQWKLILQYAALYLICAVVMLWNRNLSLTGEVILSLGVGGLWVATFYFGLLSSREREKLRSVLGRIDLARLPQLVLPKKA